MISRFVTIKPIVCWFHEKCPHPVQSKSRNTFILHLLNLPPTLSFPKTPSLSHESFPNYGSCLHVFVFPDMTESRLLRQTSFSSFVTVEAWSLVQHGWCGCVVSPVLWVLLLSSVLSSAGLSEFGELNEVPVYFCHVPAAWMRQIELLLLY